MLFTEIFSNFKDHSYIRRESWNKNLFIQLRHNVPLIRMIMFSKSESDTKDTMTIVTLNNDIKLHAEDLLANDWVDIDNC